MRGWYHYLEGHDDQGMWCMFQRSGKQVVGLTYSWLLT
jgi:hypothetical protein